MGSIAKQPEGAIPTAAAIAAVAIAMGMTAWSGKRFFLRRRIIREQRGGTPRLNKPGYTPPGPAFGGGWGLIQLALSYGGFRLIAHKANSGSRRGRSAFGLSTTP